MTVMTDLPHPKSKAEIFVASACVLGSLSILLLTLYRRDIPKNELYIFLLILASMTVAVVFSAFSIVNDKTTMALRGLTITGSLVATILIIWIGTSERILGWVGEDLNQELASKLKQETSSGWITYGQWKAQIFNAAFLFEKEYEPKNLKEILSYGFMPRHDLVTHKMRDVDIETYLIFYADEKSRSRGSDRNNRCYFKMQFIHGFKGPDRPLVYYTATSSFDDAHPSFVLFKGNNVGAANFQVELAENIATTDGAKWSERFQDSDEINCCVIADYPIEKSQPAIDFWIDTPKYTSNNASVFFFVTSEDEFARGRDGDLSALWSIKATPYTFNNEGPAEIPILFHKNQRSVKSDTPLDQGRITKLTAWAKEIDTFLDQEGESERKQAEGEGKPTEGKSERDKASDFLRTLVDHVRRSANFRECDTISKIVDTMSKTMPTLHHQSFAEPAAVEPTCVIVNWRGN